MKITLKDIAKLSGVSTTTVSHAINHTRYVSPDVAERIEKAVAETGYCAKGAAACNTGTVALLIPSFEIPFFAQLSEYLTSYLSEKGYCTLVTSCDKQDNISALCKGRDIRGIITSLQNIPDPACGRLPAGVPVVYVGGNAPGRCENSVCFDHENAFYTATHMLLTYGHDSILMCASHSGAGFATEKYRGYVSANALRGIKCSGEMKYTGAPEQQAIYDFLDNAMGSENPPTAVVCGSTFDTLCVTNYIAKHELNCPEHLSVIGCRDSSLADFSHLPLTVVSQMPDEIGSAAADMLLKAMESKAPQPAVVVQSRLVIRDSIKIVARGHFGEIAMSPEVLDFTEAEVQQLRLGSYTASLSLHDNGSQLMKTYEAGIRDVFDRLNIKLNFVTDAHFDPITQSQQIKGLLYQNPDILIALPADEKKTSDGFKTVSESNTKLVLLDNVPDILQRQDFVSCITGNDRENGHMIGRILGRSFAVDSHPKVGMLVYGVNSSSTNVRDDAVRQVLLNEFPTLEIACITPFYALENVYESCKVMLQNNPEIVGLYVSWDTAAVIAIRALNSMGRSDVSVVTADLSYDVALSMASGGPIIGIGAQRPYEQGVAAAKAAANALLGKKVPSFISVHPRAITRENLVKSWADIVKSRIPDPISDALHRPLPEAANKLHT